jgi:hypothetical protein
MGEGMTDAESKELFEERAAIREYDGGMGRDLAERAAAADVELQRHRCEVRTILCTYAKEGISGVDRRIQQISDKRGAAPAARLREEAIAQWQAGNRGKDGDWRELGLTP